MLKMSARKSICPPSHQLRGHVGRRSEQLPGYGQTLDVDHLGDAEVGQLHPAVLADHDVLGLDVAMDDPGLVGVREGVADLDDDHRGDLRVRDGVSGEVLFEGLAVDELRDDVAVVRIEP